MQFARGRRGELGPAPAPDAGRANANPMTRCPAFQSSPTAPSCRPSPARARLLESIAPGHAKPIEMTSAIRKEAMPASSPTSFEEAKALLGTYPRDPRLRRAAQGDRRLDRPALRPAHGSRLRRARSCPSTARAKACSLRRCRPSAARAFDGRPVMLVPNPFYQAYLGGAYGTGCEPIYLNATAETGHLPDLDALEREPDILRRAAAFFLCSPANPQGAVATPDYIRRRAGAGARIRLHPVLRRVLLGDLHARSRRPAVSRSPPPRRSASRICVVFNSLSKRSNLPGMRSGFVAGDGDFLETLAEIRNLTAPQMPGAVQHASAAVWSEEQHVAVDPPGLSRQVRRLRRAAGRPLRLPPARRRLLPVARHEPSRRRRAGGVNNLETVRCQGHPWRLPGPRGSARHQSRAATTFASRSCTMRPPSGKRSSVS